MAPSFEEVIAPLTTAEFLQLLRARSLTYRPAANQDRLAGLLDWKTLRGLIETGAFPPDELRVFHKTRSVSPVLYLDRGRVNASRLQNLLDQGVSLIAEPLQPLVPALGALCAEFGAQCGEKIKVAAVVTTGSGGALSLHYDPEDLLILQMEGSKRWLIYGPPVRDPIRGMAKVPPPEGEPVFDQVLQQGDSLLVPGGHWHRCENGPGLSLHLSISFRPAAGWHAVVALLPHLIEEEMFRIPLNRFADPAAKAAHEAELKARLIERIENMSWSELAAAANSLGEPDRSTE